MIRSAIASVSARAAPAGILDAGDFGIRPGNAASTNTSGLTTALERASELGATELVFGVGSYAFNSITINQPILLRGRGTDRTTFTATALSDGSDFITFTAEGQSGTPRAGGLVGVNVNQNSVGRHGLAVIGWKWAVFDDLYIGGGRAGQSAVYVTQADTLNANATEPTGNKFSRIVARAAGAALLIHCRETANHQPQVANLHFERCQFTSDTADAVHLLTDAGVTGTKNINRVGFVACNAWIGSDGHAGYHLEALGSANIVNVHWLASHAEGTNASGFVATVGLRCTTAGGVIAGIHYEGEFSTNEAVQANSDGVFVTHVDAGTNTLSSIGGFSVRNGADETLAAIQRNGVVTPGAYPIAGLPTATAYANGLALVTNPAASKGRLVYSDGSVWRYVSDDSAVV